ncbi:MAG: ornithine carbamoyltransferase [Gammaproteobacteria bacterium]|nr:ornithine carbamoyltransferase [Gammaproteobacteria bacterium]MYK46543.1 ornithine carbamoyltransferase [Gammaproteobacteria bacterium]
MADRSGSAPQTSRHPAPRHFLTLGDFTADELNRVVWRGVDLKEMWRIGQRYEPLRGRTLAMIFELSSTRTRVSFEAGMHQLGGHALSLSPNDSHLGRGEPVEDTARVLSEMVDAVMIRTFDHATVERFAAAASIPVINGMTSRSHPCQLLADMQTLVEYRGEISGTTVAFVGDGHNMCNSYIGAAGLFGFELRIATPSGHEPSQGILPAPNVELVDSPAHAVDGADLVVTDVWSSMGHEGEEADRRAAFVGYQVSPALLDRAKPDALFMHCLPAHRGEEISNDMLDDPRSVAWVEAGNRLHSQKALLEFLLVA